VKYTDLQPHQMRGSALAALDLAATGHVHAPAAGIELAKVLALLSIAAELEKLRLDQQ